MQMSKLVCFPFSLYSLLSLSSSHASFTLKACCPPVPCDMLCHMFSRCSLSLPWRRSVCDLNRDDCSVKLFLSSRSADIMCDPQWWTPALTCPHSYSLPWEVFCAKHPRVWLREHVQTVFLCMTLCLPVVIWTMPVFPRARPVRCICDLFNPWPAVAHRDQPWESVWDGCGSLVQSFGFTDAELQQLCHLLAI